MRVREAKRAAEAWVERVGSGQPGFLGAYFAGSIVGMGDDDDLAPSSDVDIVVVTAGAVDGLQHGKHLYRGVLLEPTTLSWGLLSSPETVLSSYHLAGSFRVDTIIADPTGRLSDLQRVVAAGFAKRSWVRRRCRDAFRKSAAGLDGAAQAAVDPEAPFHQQVLSWVFPTGVMTQVLLVAALRNPTVRRRYLAVREVLEAYGRAEIYEQLLALLGCAQVTQAHLESHLPGLAAMFDAAASQARTPLSFSPDITALARPIAIGGSQEMIEEGDHREAAFWMVVTAARCQTILAADAAPEQWRAHVPAFEALLADLGIRDASDLWRRAGQGLRFLPALWEVAEDILARNPEIVPDG
ncbi:MAG: hypothetical protein R6X16_15350 [Anaerolineae bacterium]